MKQKAANRHLLVTTFMDGMNGLLSGEPITTYQRQLVERVYLALIDGKDARPLIGTEPTDNRPKDSRAAGKALWCSIEIALLEREGSTIEAAKESVRQSWKLSPETIRRAWLTHKAPAREAVAQYGDKAKLRRDIAAYRRGVTKPR